MLQVASLALAILGYVFVTYGQPEAAFGVWAAALFALCVDG